MMRLWIRVLPLIVVAQAALYNPCVGPSTLDGPCEYDADCAGNAVQCLRSRCVCHTSYTQETRTNSDGVTTKSCRKLPDRVGASCLDGKCAPPLFCIDNRCACGRGTIQEDSTTKQCYDNRGHDASCSSHSQCREPFMACVGGKCGCISGTRSIRDRTGKVTCLATPNCPFGGKPGSTCTLLVTDRKAVENAGNSKEDGEKSDTCPTGQFCFTSPGAVTGHCCEATCPLGSTPTATNCKNCHPNTHYCHRVSGETFSFAVCCQRPCQANDVNSVFVNGQCRARTALNEECTNNGQCDGDATMKCTGGKCVCNNDMTPLTDRYTNPAQVCRNSNCSVSLSRGPHCHDRVGVGQKCLIQEQCPDNSGCFRGRCMCKCDHIQTGSSCVLKTEPSTVTPSTTKAPGDLIGSLLGGFGKGKGGQLGGLGDILGGFGKGGSGGSFLDGLFGNNG